MSTKKAPGLADRSLAGFEVLARWEHPEIGRVAPDVFIPLAERAGVTRRTVRFYIQKGVLSPPQGAGRGARYTREHLAQLEQIAAAKEQKVTLEYLALRRSEAPQFALARSIEPPAPTPLPPNTT